jgi:hypothetical protein
MNIDIGLTQYWFTSGHTITVYFCPRARPDNFQLRRRGSGSPSSHNIRSLAQRAPKLCRGFD